MNIIKKSNEGLEIKKIIGHTDGDLIKVLANYNGYEFISTLGFGHKMPVVSYWKENNQICIYLNEKQVEYLYKETGSNWNTMLYGFTKNHKCNFED